MFFTQGDPLNFALLPTCTDIYIKKHIIELDSFFKITV